MSPILIILIILAILFLALFILVVDWMTRYAYDRKSPKLPKFLVNTLMRENLYNKEEKKRIKEEAMKLKEQAKIRIEIKGYDGVKLVAHYLPCENAERIVIAAHGWRSGWNYDYRTLAPFFHMNKTSVLMIELRGHGESGDRYLYYGKKERFDIADWTKYAAEHLAKDLPIYVMGMSAGAMSTLMSTTAGLHKNTRGVIADSSTGSARNFGYNVVGNLGVNPKFLYTFIRIDARIRLGMDDNEYTAYEAMRENKLPVLFIQGTKDRVADLKDLEKLYDTCQSPKFKLIVEGAGHTRCVFKDPEKYQDSLLRFFAFCEGKNTPF